MTTIVHFKKSPYDIYIGRPSIWANPFTHLPLETTKAKFQAKTRKDSIECYEGWIMEHPELLDQLHTLKDKVLGCWCKPKSCHGDVLARLTNEGINKFLLL